MEEIKSDPMIFGPHDRTEATRDKDGVAWEFNGTLSSPDFAFSESDPATQEVLP